MFECEVETVTFMGGKLNMTIFKMEQRSSLCLYFLLIERDTWTANRKVHF